MAARCPARRAGRRCCHNFPLTHLWFLYVLLEFYAALLVLRAGVVWLDRTAGSAIVSIVLSVW